MNFLNEFIDDFLVGTDLTREQSQYASIYRREDNYLYTNNIGCHGIVDGPEITYQINSDGFRSRHFNEFDPKLKNILFAGCSITLGEGLPEDVTWYSRLSKEIGVNNFYNVSSTGASTRLIVKNILTFIRKYGAPEFIFVLLPNFARDLQYDPISNKIISCLVHPQWIAGPKKFITQRVYTLNYKEQYGAFNSIENIRILEDICILNNIKLIWSSWNNTANEVFEKIKFNNYFTGSNMFSFDGTDSDFLTKENVNNLPYWSKAQDGIHPGSGWNELVYKDFLKEFLRRGYDKQN